MQSAADQVGVRELLEAGVHFGHQAKRWNPKMKRFIFAERAGVHIIDLDQTITLLDRALEFARSIGEAGREVLFVGTKKQAQLTIAEQAMRCGQPYVAERYIGGMLTNFQTIQPRIQYFKDLAVRVDETPEEDRSGKDWFAMAREFQKLRRNFAGLTEMERLPGAIFVVDPKREELLVKEANRLKIPVIALTDTNCDPEVVDYIIPGNDDAIRSINLISRLMADSILQGKGEDEVHPEDRLVPPVVEEARVSEEVAEQGATASAVANGSANGASTEAATPVESAEETSAEPTPEPVEDTVTETTADSSVEENGTEASTEEVAVSEEDADAEDTADPEEPDAAVTQSGDDSAAVEEAVAEGEEAPADEAPADEAPVEEATVEEESAVEEDPAPDDGVTGEAEETAGDEPVEIGEESGDSVEEEQEEEK